MEKKHNNKEQKVQEHKKKYEFEVEEVEERIAPRRPAGDVTDGEGPSAYYWR